MGKNATIRAIWENSNHGTRLEDIQAAYEAGEAEEREACAKVCQKRAANHASATRESEADECAKEIRMRSNAKDQPGRTG